MRTAEEVTFPGDDVIAEAMNCIRLAFNEANPDNPVAKIDDLSRVALIDKMDGNLIFGVIILKKGVWASSYHCLPGDESKVREKIERGHRPLLVAALWEGNILCAETGYKLVDLDEASAIDPRIRERLKTFYAVKNG